MAFRRDFRLLWSPTLEVMHDFAAIMPTMAYLLSDSSHRNSECLKEYRRAASNRPSIAVIADFETKAPGLVLGAFIAESHICGRE